MNKRSCLQNYTSIKLLEMFNKMIDTEPNSISFSDAMNSSMKLIADIVDFDSAVIYRFADVNCGKRFRQVYLWNKAQYGTIPSNGDLIKILPNLALIETWAATLLEDNIVNIYTDNMSADETAFLGIDGVKSMVLVPVFINGEFWGCTAFQEHTGERFFCKYSADFLNIAVRKRINNILSTGFTESIEPNFITNTELNESA